LLTSKDEQGAYFIQIFDSDGLQIKTVQIPFPSQNIHYAGDSIFVFWGLACLRISFTNNFHDPKKRLKNLLDGFDTKISSVGILNSESHSFINLKSIISMQSKGGSFKSFGDSLIDLSKESNPFHTLTNLLTQSLKDIKGILSVFLKSNSKICPFTLALYRKLSSFNI
jgi:hypothetical protein